MKPILITTIFCYFIIACNQSEEAQMQASENTQYGFKLVDSVLIDFMGNLQIVDYEHQSKRFLAIESTKGDIIEFDKSGKIHFQDNRKEGPNGYGNFVEKMSFWGPDKRIVQAVRDVIIYDNNWNILEKHPIKFQPAFFVMNNVKERAITFKAMGREVMVLNDNAIQDLNKVELNGDEPYYRLSLLDLNTGEEFGVLPFPENHPYLSIPNLIKGEVNPSWTINKEKLYVKMSFSDFLEVYDLETLELERMVPISGLTQVPLSFGVPNLRLTSFDAMFPIMKDGMKRGSFNPTKLSFTLKDKEINLFSIGHPIAAEILDPIEQTNFQEYNKVVSAHYKSTYLPMHNGKKAGVEFPKDFKGVGLLSFDGNKILCRLTDAEMEYEPDMLTYYIYEFVEKK